MGKYAEKIDKDFNINKTTGSFSTLYVSVASLLRAEDLRKSCIILSTDYPSFGVNGNSKRTTDVIIEHERLSALAVLDMALSGLFWLYIYSDITINGNKKSISTYVDEFVRFLYKAVLDDKDFRYKNFDDIKEYQSLFRPSLSILRIDDALDSLQSNVIAYETSNTTIRLFYMEQACKDIIRISSIIMMLLDILEGFDIETTQASVEKMFQFMSKGVEEKYTN